MSRTNHTNTLAQEVAASLRESLREGHYTPGTRLIELALAEEMSVSQNTIREALRLLENEGWLVYRARRGVRVQSFNADEADEVYALMATVERLAFHWLTRRQNRADMMANLRPPIERARQELDRRHLRGTRDSLATFHRQIATIPNRPQSQAVLARLLNQAYLLDVQFTRELDIAFTTYRERMVTYENLLGVIKFGDFDTAQQALHDAIIADGRPIVRWLAMHA